MKISVNGEHVTLPDACTVDALLERLELGGRPCAVEVNRAVVPRRDHAGHLVRDGDVIEVVTLVGGG